MAETDAERMARLGNRNTYAKKAEQANRKRDAELIARLLGRPQFREAVQEAAQRIAEARLPELVAQELDRRERARQDAAEARERAIRAAAERERLNRQASHGALIQGQHSTGKPWESYEDHRPEVCTWPTGPAWPQSAQRQFSDTVPPVGPAVSEPGDSPRWQTVRRLGEGN